MNAHWVAPILFVYILGSIGLGLLLFEFGKRRRKERLPMDFSLRRGPGESLRRKIEKMDDDFPQKLILVLVSPLIIAGGALTVTAKFGKVGTVIGLVLASLFMILGVAAIAFWVGRYGRERRNYLLGYLGERAVADALEPLSRKGFWIFHDIPGKEGKDGFNIDHVAIGPTGIFAIETKTRRKRPAREGFEDHKVFYDGRQLIWPWGEDTHGLGQAANEAEWIAKWVKQMTGIAANVQPVLALPGWWVETRALGAVSVQNHKNLVSNILGKGIRVLDDGQIDLITRQFDALCRDVTN